MLEAYKDFWKKAFKFSGRTTRKDFWLVLLANFLIGIVLGILTNISSSLVILTIIYSIASGIASISLDVRRLHDINKSGWSYWLALIPIVGPIILLVFFCTDSVNENNQYNE